MKSFQAILLSIFGAFFVGALIFFAVNKSNSAADLPAITVWGTLPERSFATVLEYARKDPSLASVFKKVQITYEEKQDTAFDAAFIEALANGAGPDAVIISQDMLMRHKNKFFPITAQSIPPRSYKDWFVPIAGLFQDAAATYALPLFVDPMVMYWNVDTLANAGYTTPPRAWIEMADFSKNITKRDAAGNIRQSALAFGEYSNIPNAKDIIANLLLQTGIPLADYGDEGRFTVNLSRPLQGSGAAALGAAEIERVLNTSGDDADSLGVDSSGSGGGGNGSSQSVLGQGASALRFYTDFANPAKKVYSWNRGMPRARDSFAAGDTSLYFGAASEKPLIQAKNPNLNFDVALMPQISGSKVRTNFGRIYGFAIVAKSPRAMTAFTVGTLLMDPTVSAYFARSFYAAPARNEALARGFVAAAGRPAGTTGGPVDDGQVGQSILAREADQVIFNQSALSARGWLDPDRFGSGTIFKAMIDAIVSGQSRPAEALNSAETRLRSMIPIQ